MSGAFNFTGRRGPIWEFGCRGGHPTEGFKGDAHTGEFSVLGLIVREREAGDEGKAVARLSA